MRQKARDDTDLELNSRARVQAAIRLVQVQMVSGRDFVIVDQVFVESANGRGRDVFMVAHQDVLQTNDKKE